MKLISSLVISFLLINFSGFSDSENKLENQVIIKIDDMILKTKDFYKNSEDSTPEYIQEKNFFNKIDSDYDEDLKYIEKNLKKTPAFISEKLNEISKKEDLSSNEIYILLKCLSFYPVLTETDIETILFLMEFSDSLLYTKCVDALLKPDNHKMIKDYLINKYHNSSEEGEKANLALLLVQLDIGNIDFLLKDYINLKESLATITIFLLAGDQTIPFLRKQLKSKDRNTQHNSIMLLGSLLDFESYDELKAIYLDSNNKKLKLDVLSMMLALLPSLEEAKELKGFFKECLEDELKKEKRDKKNYNYLRESIAFLHDIKFKLAEFKKTKKFDKKKFKEEYDILFESKGENGDLKIISENSSYKDEAELRNLKARIVRGFIDVYIEDYNKINEIIRFNRLIKSEN